MPIFVPKYLHSALNAYPSSIKARLFDASVATMAKQSSQIMTYYIVPTKMFILEYILSEHGNLFKPKQW